MSKKKSLKPGQAILCELLEKEPGGYRGNIVSYDVEAFVPSRDELEIGTTVPTTFVCMSNNRALVTFAFVVGTTEKVQFGLKNVEETPFTIWADSYPSNVKLRRAVDVIMPSITGKVMHSLPAKDLNIVQLVKDIESAKLTGCIKSASDEAKSRSAALLLNGRAVGCIYGNKKNQEAHMFEKALVNMFNDTQVEDASILVYELPKEIVLSMASLFIGCPVDEAISLKSKADNFIKDVLPKLESTKETACFTLTTGEKRSQGLGFLYQGVRQGSFSVVDQVFKEDFDQLYEMANHESGVASNAYLLPKEMISDTVLLGYTLSSYLAK